MTDRRDDGNARPLKIGTRGSELALTQARWVARRLEEAGVEVAELETVRTTGDRRSTAPLHRHSQPGLFTATLDHALLDGRVDLAVHSLKDLPTDIHPELELVAVPPREEPSDALVLPEGSESDLRSLAAGARVGSSSLRRQALCRAFRPDLRVEPIRGNVDTRLAKVDGGEYDAAIMASAGLRRMGLSARASQLLEVREWPPAPGQGALAVMARRHDPMLQAARSALGALDSAPSRAAVEAERTVLQELGAGCSLPVGAVGLPYREGLRLWAMVLSADGRRVVRTDATGRMAEARGLGRRVAQTLRERGAAEILEEVRTDQGAGAADAGDQP